MSWFKAIFSRVAAYVIGQVVLFAVGGATTVTAVFGALADVHPGWLAGSAVGSFLLFFGAADLYRKTHPDERLRELHVERIKRWRQVLKDWERYYPYVDEEETIYFLDTTEYIEMRRDMTYEEQRKFDAIDHPHARRQLLYELIARLERKWQVA